MKRKHCWILGLSLILCISARAQEFFEVNWKSDGVSYTGLLIYYSDQDAVMRIRYTLNSEYKVAEFKCQYKKLNLSGKEGFLLDGSDAKIVYGNTNSSYSSDNFYFYKEASGNYGLPYTIDDAHLAKENPSQYLQRVNSWEKISTTKFTTQFVKNYFEAYEPLYNKLLAYNIQNNNVSSVNYRISAAAYGGDKWTVCMSKGTGITQQSTKRDPVFPEAWIKEKWAESKEITNVAYGAGEWLVVTSANTKITTQAYYYSSSFPADWVKEKWDKNYRISSLAYGDGKWVVVMSQGTGITMQSYKFEAGFPADWIKEKWDDKYRISAVAYGAGEWVVIMSQNTGIGMQTYKRTAAYPGDWVLEKWKDAYEITNIVYGAGEWFVTMAQNTGITQQTYNITTLFPRDWVQEKWDGKEPAAANNNNNAGNLAPDPSNVTIHLIVVANTLISDIGASCKVDEERIVNECSIIARELNVGFRKTVINGSNFTKTQVDAALNALSPGANDVVIFVYSGHGFRWSNQTNQYPSIALKYSNYGSLSNDNSYLLADIYKKVTDKGARLNIVLGDCCNSPIGVSSRGGDFALSSRSGTSGDAGKLKQLFLNKRGNLIVAAASPGETSCGNSRDGGYLVSSFFQALSKETSYLNTATPDWERIVKNAVSTARYNTQNLNGCTTQNGIYYTTVK